MTDVTFRFYGELNDFLTAERRQRAFAHQVNGRSSVKDAIEALGVPHPEVDLILVNDAAQDFGYALRAGDRVSVYPVFRSIDIEAPIQLRPPLGEARFVLDTHLGRLASYLRILGFDALYRNDYTDNELARVSAAETRVLLTRDRGLLKHGAVVYGYFVRATDPGRQIVEVVRRYGLSDRVAPFQRCPSCNGVLRSVAKADVLHRLLPKTRQYYDEFKQCAGCDQVYWRGSHYERMRSFVEGLLKG